MYMNIQLTVEDKLIGLQSINELYPLMFFFFFRTIQREFKLLVLSNSIEYSGLTETDESLRGPD